MPSALSSPGFLIALAILVANDLWWKAAYGNWLTGKLSDFAGLFVVVVLFAAFRPTSERAIAVTTAVAFALWKSPAAQPVIDAWNTIAPYRIARVVDYSDLLALVMIPVARQYVLVARPLAPAAVRYPVVALAMLAILGTSKAPPAMYPYQQAEHVTFSPRLIVYDVAVSPATLLDRLRAADFTVAPAGPTPDVAIVSGATCQASQGDPRRLVNADVSVQSAGDGAAIVVRSVLLCHRDKSWDREAAAAVFESEVLERVGRWRRQPSAER